MRKIIFISFAFIISIGYKCKEVVILSNSDNKLDDNKGYLNSNLILKHAKDIFRYSSNYGWTCHGSHSSHESHRSHHSHYSSR